MAITQHLRQATETWDVHPHTQQRTKALEILWQIEWGKHKNIHETARTTEQHETYINKFLYMQQKPGKNKNISTMYSNKTLNYLTKII